MSEIRHLPPDYSPDYLATTAEAMKHACGSHFSERKATAWVDALKPVVTPVVSKNAIGSMPCPPLTTDYSLEVIKEKEGCKNPTKEYARARGSRSHRPLRPSSGRLPHPSRKAM